MTAKGIAFQLVRIVRLIPITMTLLVQMHDIQSAPPKFPTGRLSFQQLIKQ